ncbi:MAG: tetratricopeptide repeat protein [Bacteroidetes bacterium]|nr:tetratricopeptide repeat protein [Bacteroidota bacterium]
MKRYLYSLVIATVTFATSAFAQNVDQGKKFFYYERYKSAKETLEKVLAANPNDVNATYWLGQTLYEMKDTAAARALYQKALSSNGNAPLLLAGMGGIELIEGKKDEARQRFETAISLSKGKDVAVFNAVGRANTEAKAGDPDYAIEKLNQATQVKGFNSPETYMLMGDAYRKKVDGGNAVSSYQKALTLDPNYAAAKTAIGKIYLTQRNADIFVPAFEDAIRLDPNYAPAYFELYYYYFNRDINKAIGYYDKYMTVTDVTPANDYERASIAYASRNYDEAINKAQQNISQLGDKADPRYYKLLAYSYDDKGDSINAKKYLDDYFAKQSADDFVPKDYAFRANLLSKFPGQESEALASFDKAIAMDTTVAGRSELMADAAALAKKTGNRFMEAEILGQLYKQKKDPSNVDLYNWGFAKYQAQQYQSADSIFSQYIAKYPNEIFGYLWKARSLQAQDTTMEKGLAVQAYEELAEKSRSIDSVKFKGQAITSYFYLVSYYNDIKKDKDTAIKYLDKVLEVDPTNPDAARIKGILAKPPKKASSSGKAK